MLQALHVEGIQLRGLQELRNEDLIVLGHWLEDQGYRSNTERLPWIWTMSPLVIDSHDAEEDIQRLVADWNEEGPCCIISPYPPRQN